MSISSQQKKKFYERGNILPKCVNIGCSNDVAVRNWANWSFKSECTTCQSDRKKGIIREGITIHKKKYCENIDGRLGFFCPVKSKENWIGFESSLDLDHINGNHDDNTPLNVDTYCKCCHSRKSLEMGDCSNKKNSARAFNI